MKKTCATCGLIFDELHCNIEVCPVCHSSMEDAIIEYEDFSLPLDDIIILEKISKDKTFMKAMDDLKKKDPIEYALKLSQFKNEINQREELEKRKEDQALSFINQLRCPKCGSTNITTGARGFSFWTGFIGASKTVNRCGNCGHTWKP